jgi:hypothetical protein
VGVFILLSVLGVTTSSIGADALRRDKVHHSYSTTWGEPQDIRSDEYMTWSPITIGAITAGPEGTTNPLGVSNNYFHQFPSGPASAIVFFDGTTAALLGPWVPDAMLFAGKWWLPTLLLVLGVPAWFRQVTGSRRWGYLACALIFFAPANAWWSGLPVNTLGFMFAACALLLAAHDRLERGHRWSAFATVLLSAVLMARYPSYYQPWAIVLGFPVLIATALVILTREGARSRKWAILVVAGLAGAALTGLSMLENLGAIRAGLDTVYPGHRRSSAMAMPLSRVFGAPALAGLEQAQGGLARTTNASELSSSFTALLLASAVVLPMSWRQISGLSRWAVGTFFVASAGWLLWCTTNLGAASSALPLVNMVPSFRAAQVVGFLATITFCLLMAFWEGPGKVGIAVAAGCLVAGITLYAGWMMRGTEAPGLAGWSVVAGGAAAGLCVVLLMGWPRSGVPMAFCIVAVALLSGLVNPIQFGLGDLRGTPAANFLIAEGRTAREHHTVWASDSAPVDALFFATATPSLSFRQQIGPDRKAWARLDPGSTHTNMWNRGGTFVRFAWTDSRTVSWKLPSADQVVVSTSPCTVAGRIPSLKNIVSAKPLKDDCLSFRRRLKFGGHNNYVYAIDRH